MAEEDGIRMGLGRREWVWEEEEGVGRGGKAWKVMGSEQAGFSSVAPLLLDHSASVMQLKQSFCLGLKAGNPIYTSGRNRFSTGKENAVGR